MKPFQLRVDVRGRRSLPCDFCCTTVVLAPTFYSTVSVRAYRYARGTQEDSWEPSCESPPPKGSPLWTPRGFRAASISKDTCQFFGASLFGFVCLDIHRGYPIRVSNRTSLCSHRSSALREVLMQTFTHQSHTAVGRRMCIAHFSVKDSNKSVPLYIKTYKTE